MNEIPCKRPRVRVNELLGLDRVAAVCDVPGCGWHYDNTVITDVREQATRHRQAHRAAVPKIEQTGTGFTHEAHCPDHGLICHGTRTDMQASLDYHLRTEHGLVTCP